MEFFVHHAQYYETDQMGIIHHSNFIRWMEEARVYMMEELGMSYKLMEKLGIISPVLNIKCDYKDMVHFDDYIEIYTFIPEFNGIRLTVGYKMRNRDTGKICAIGESKHCFLDKSGKLINLKKQNPDFYNMFEEYKNMYKEELFK
ncbi:MAG: acyl-CoA thioesterase [Clostridia bacterium]|jgi:acyl-CoA thioester hydrolase|nr:acyl-CoA thioesterase [Clostridia bacterium]MCI1958501.1 acyl-CoA thioesterase [Clostridia bacterium]MCI2000771.1 acyl-CoA thioesterase [Clostridia bacterium]MCI2015437.1 acyl-CoA thioesterase [Clostridia bacterium]